MRAGLLEFVCMISSAFALKALLMELISVSISSVILYFEMNKCWEASSYTTNVPCIQVC